jgi:ubiquinone/menaquinone biosynthesis C-methylase UbiE
MSPFLNLKRFRRSRGPVELAVDMAGVRMGERVLHVGVGDPRVFALVSSKVGLTGRACATVDSAAAQATLEKAAARQGVLVEIALVSGGRWPYDSSSFDVAVVDANALLRSSATDRQNRLVNTVRVVRPGGRVIAIRRRPRGIAARLGFEPASGPPGAQTLELVRALGQAGCRPVRVLAEREGLSFVEGFRPGAPVI